MDQAWICVAFFWVFAILCLFWMYRQHVLFSNQLDKMQKVAEDGIDALGDSLKKARERIAELEEDYRYEVDLAKRLACDLQEKCKEVEEMAEQKLALEKALNVHAESLKNVRGNYERNVEVHAAEIKKMEERMRKMQDYGARLQNCIDAIAQAAAVNGVDLDREVECDCES